MLTNELLEFSKKYIMNTYNRFPVVFIKGRGAKLFDSDNREYLDFVAGIAACNLGHCHPKVTVAFQKQAQRLVHISNLYHNEPQIKLAKLLVENSFADKVFFCNSGAEANEAAIKLVRKYAKEKLKGNRFEIITMEKSFHGRTMATITATGQEKVQKGFEPLLPGFKYAPFNNIDAVKKAINKKTAAVMVEPIQGEGGVNIPDNDYLKKLRRLCNDEGILLVFDEVQTGMGRTGRLFAYEHYNIEPDIMTLAKALGNGVAIGAMLARDSVAEVFTPGSHATTFGGNPLACSAAVAALETIMEDGIMFEDCVRMGDYLIKGLKELKKEYSFIKEIRGKGLLIGMDLTIDGKDIVMESLKDGLLINCTMDKILRFLPPLIVTKEEIDSMLEILYGVLKRMKK
ncbi:MAG: acetylornithine aminotransferase [Nitrospirae bacterium RBG_19FT_COMBO_42_15]|nr:MAG: acetylornithine aminotransferase [Nitrospirae bacterium RBG_19FT_COMBO_42_15]